MQIGPAVFLVADKETKSKSHENNPVPSRGWGKNYGKYVDNVTILFRIYDV